MIYDKHVVLIKTRVQYQHVRHYMHVLGRHGIVDNVWRFRRTWDSSVSMVIAQAPGFPQRPKFEKILSRMFPSFKTNHYTN